MNVLFFIVIILNLQEQRIGLKLAEFLYGQENYYDAITEYKRVLFFNQIPDTQSYIFYKLGLCYRNEEDWQNALECLQLSASTAPDDSTRDERKIDLAVTYMAKQDYSASEFLLIKTKLFSKYKAIKHHAQLILCLNYVYSFKWEKAQKVLEEYLNENPQTLLSNPVKMIHTLLIQAQHQSLKSPRVAKILSTVIPGAGQLYAGDWENGAKALLLNIALSYLCVDAVIENRYQDVIGGLVLFQRYYLGNRYHAEKIAHSYNRELNSRCKNKIMQSLLWCRVGMFN